MKPAHFDRVWNILIVAAAAYSAVSIPARLVLDMHEQASMLGVLDGLVTLIFSADVVLRFRTSRRAAADSEHAARVHHSEYSATWRILDCIAAVPFSLLPVVGSIQVFRLTKLARVAQFMLLWQKRDVQRANILRLAFFAFWLALSTHWIACGWLALQNEPFESDSGEKYLGAMYWTMQTLSTVGYGDVKPSSNSQKMYAIGVMIFGVAVYGYIIGNVASVLAKIDPAKGHYLENLERLNAFLSYRSIPQPLQQRIRDYYEYLWEKRLGYDESSLVADLPPSLRTEVSLFLKKDIIEKVPLFKGAGETFIREIALGMRPVVYMPGDYVFRAGDSAGEMYFINTGRFEVVSKDGNTINTLTDGDFFGEIALFLNTPRTAGVRAVQYCDVYRLDKEAFDRVLLRYPEMAAHIEAMAKERQLRV